MEIERKFLVSSHQYRKEAEEVNHLVQGFLNTDPYRTVRIRVYNDKGYLTIKGISSNSGVSRKEWEFEIDPQQARELMELAEDPPIEKKRYLVRSGDHCFEVDEFEGANTGLVIAEIELEREDEEFERPSWLGREVTGEIKYYNAQLSKNPFGKWKH